MTWLFVYLAGVLPSALAWMFTDRLSYDERTGRWHPDAGSYWTALLTGILWPLLIAPWAVSVWRDRHVLADFRRERRASRELEQMQRPWDEARNALLTRREHNNVLSREWEREYNALSRGNWL